MYQCYESMLSECKIAEYRNITLFLTTISTQHVNYIGTKVSCLYWQCSTSVCIMMLCTQVWRMIFKYLIYNGIAKLVSWMFTHAGEIVHE